MAMKDGGQVYPGQKYEYDSEGNVLQYQESGMSIRDYFAAAALTGLIAADDPDATDLLLVMRAYQYADAMLKEREK